MPLTITTSQPSGLATVMMLSLEGALDINTYEQLQDSAQAALEGGAKNILLDFAGVNIITSAGVRGLSHIFRLLRQTASPEAQKQLDTGALKAPNFKLLNPDHNIENVLRMAGVDSFLEIYFDRAEALASFQ